jgi:hypothetical protein
MDSDARRVMFLGLLRSALKLSTAEINVIDRLIQKIQSGVQLHRYELLYFAEIKHSADIANISIPADTARSKPSQAVNFEA